MNDIHVGLAICTYKKEEYIKKNLKRLNQEIILNGDSDANGHLSVFVADNGQTLDTAALSNEYTHVFPNRNVGGTGGFTRTLVEMLHCENVIPSHVIFTDDDIVFEPDIFARTYAFLACLRPEYMHCSIGAASLRLEQMNIQHTRGDCWNGGFGMKRNVKAGYDLTNVEKLLKNELEEMVQFNAWLFSCVPIKTVRTIGFPLPIFIHCDDVEYGLRNGAPVIHLNGIGAWHSFGAVYSGASYYYDIRNALIVNALHVPNFPVKRVFRYLRSKMKDSILRFRYYEVDLMLRGVEDFCKGIDWLKAQDPLELNKEVSQLSYPFLPLSELPNAISFPAFWASMRFDESKCHKVKRLLTLNGWLCRSKRVTTVSLLYSRPINFYRVRRAIQYNQSSNTGILTEKNYHELFRVLLRYLKIKSFLKKRIQAVASEYRARYQEITDEAYWRKCLNISADRKATAVEMEKTEEPKTVTRPSVPKTPQAAVRPGPIKRIVKKIWGDPYPYSYRAALDTQLRIVGCWVLKKLNLSRLNARMQLIQQAKDRHAGERCFVIGLGPSLRIEDLEKLKGEYTFAANSIFLLFDRTDWRPTYYCRMDKIGSQRLIDGLTGSCPLDGEIPLKEAYLHSKIQVKNKTGKERYVHINHGNHTKARMLNRQMIRSDDIDVSIYEMYTVTNMAIEIAMYMGFKEIYLLGVDCDYSNKGGKVHVVETKLDDVMRRNPNRQRMQNYTVSFMRDAYACMERAAKEKGVKIYNATRGGALEAFERVDFDALELR